MPTFLQAVEIPERCYLGEVLLWVAFQRLPIADYYEGTDIRESTEAGDLVIECVDWEITEEECKRADIPPDPAYLALMQGKSLRFPSFYDDLLKQYDPKEPDTRARLADARAEAVIYEREYLSWKERYLQAIEYPASRIFVALKSGQLATQGRLLPGRNKDDTSEQLKRDAKDVFDFSVGEIPSTFWSLSGIDFEASAAGNGSAFYCHVACRTADMLSVFPGERQHIGGIERIGDSFILDETIRKPPTQNKRGRPAYPWDPFHVEVAALLQRNELPSKKEAAIQHFQTWFESELDVQPSRAAIGEKLKPYYDKFGRRSGGQKTPA